MAAKNYQWKTSTDILSGGYAGEDVGVIGGATDWQTTSASSGNAHESYYFRDSDYMDNGNSSRVVVEIDETWTASIDDHNNLTITLQTKISSIRRDDIVGNPGVKDRNMFARRDQNGNVVWSTYNDPITTAHTILASPGVTLDSYTFTLAPGENLSRPSVYFRANVVGHDDDAIPSIYVDLMGLGVSFKNILPRDYVPDAIYNGNNIWLSHNRDGGDLRIYTGTKWSDNLRTVGGGTEMGNPPSIYRDGKWYNRRKLGKE